MEEVRDSVLAVPGVTGIGIGLWEDEPGEVEPEPGEVEPESEELEGDEDVEPVVHIYVEEGIETPEGLPAELPREAPFQIVPMNTEPIALPDERRYQELKGGIRISHPWSGSGTMGAIVRGTDSEGNTAYYGLTAEHVVGRTAGESYPHVVFQPSGPLPLAGISEAQALADAEAARPNAVGRVVNYARPEPIPLVVGAIVGDIDAALFEVDLAAEAQRPYSAAIADSSGEGEMVPKVTASAQPQLCQVVRKRGIATGYTVGRVIGANCTLAWSETTKPEKQSTYLVDQIVIKTYRGNPHPNFLFGDEGDSGSLVLDKETPTALGLLWGKDLRGFRCQASKIWKVENAFGVTTEL